MMVYVHYGAKKAFNVTAVIVMLLTIWSVGCNKLCYM